MEVETSSVLNNIIKILDCFSIGKASLGVREIARMVDMAPSTVGRIMQDLRSEGLLEQDQESRSYRLGSKILGWAGVLLASTDLREVALPFMQELKARTSETISLYQLDGQERLCIERIESDQNIRMVTRIGQRLPLYAGSAGKAMLAFLPETAIMKILSGAGLIPFTTSTMTDPELIQKELTKIKQCGYSISHGEWISDASGVAAPLFGIRNEVIGAISISGPSVRFTKEKIQECAKMVLEISVEISRNRGFIQNVTMGQEE